MLDTEWFDDANMIQVTFLHNASKDAANDQDEMVDEQQFLDKQYIMVKRWIMSNEGDNESVDKYENPEKIKGPLSLWKKKAEINLKNRIEKQ